MEFLTPEFIKTNRIRRGMTQKDLALLINVTPTTVSFWEKGTCKPRLKYHETLMKILSDTNRNPKTENELSIFTPDFIKSNRERLGMTKKELADACHVSLGAIWRWESGESYPQIRCRKPLLDILSRSDPYPPSQNTPAKQNPNDLSSILTPKFIKFNRERRGMAQKELANLIGVSETAICSWESGLHKPQLLHHEILLDILSDSNPYHIKPEDKSSILTPKFIKSNRIRRGMTQKELADLTNVSSSNVCSWESGKLYPNIKHHEILLEILSDPEPLHENKSSILTSEFIKLKRTKRGMTRKKMAQACCVSESAIASWEHGINKPSITRHEKLTKVLSETNEVFPPDFNISILTPEFIKSNRIRRNMSKVDLAKLINVDKSTISHWESGRNRVNLKTAPLLYDVLTNPNTYMR